MCLKVRVKALLRRRSEEDLFGMCGTIHYKLDKPGKETSVSVCAACSQRNIEEQLLGGSLTRTQEHLRFVDICRVPSKEYEGRAR
jgi:hypothetical protein